MKKIDKQTIAEQLKQAKELMKDVKSKDLYDELMCTAPDERADDSPMTYHKATKKRSYFDVESNFDHNSYFTKSGPWTIAAPDPWDADQHQRLADIAQQVMSQKAIAAAHGLSSAVTSATVSAKHTHGLDNVTDAVGSSAISLQELKDVVGEALREALSSQPKAPNDEGFRLGVRAVASAMSAFLSHARDSANDFVNNLPPDFLKTHRNQLTTLRLMSDTEAASSLGEAITALADVAKVGTETDITSLLIATDHMDAVGVALEDVICIADDLRYDVEASSDDVKKLEAQLETADDVREALQQQVVELKKEISEQGETIDELTNALTQETEKLREKRAENADLHTLTGELEGTIFSQELLIDNLRAEVIRLMSTRD